MFQSPVATAQDLVNAFPLANSSNAGPDHNVLAVLGELADNTLVDGLTERGYRVERVDGYENTAPNQAPVELVDVDAVVFFSPSAAERFHALYGPNWPAVCLGPRTAAHASTLGFAVLATASPHTEPGITSTLRSLLPNT